MRDIAEKLADVRKQIAAAVAASPLSQATVQLIAVSKGHDANAVRDAISAGQRVYGENRVQEARLKFTDLKDAYPELQLHLIGPLQSNKAEEAVKLFDVIQTLDRPKLADALASAIRKVGRKPKIYIEVNVADEARKSGVAPGAVGELLAYCRSSAQLTISGLMCIPPRLEDPIPYFKQLQKLSKDYALSHLSMGMSNDYSVAIKCGATEVRVGTAIFGDRG